MNYSIRLAVAACILTLASGCATTGRTPDSAGNAGNSSNAGNAGNAVDPLEGINRAVFNFNDKVDQVALKPAAQVYRKVVPTFVQIGVGNFFGNLGDVWTGVNNVLQGKVGDGVNDFMRFAFNTTLGLGGVIDISSAAGMPKHKEDFGQTLGHWGVGSGAYVVLPLLGPSTVRDTVALPLDFKGDLWSYVDPVSVRNSGTVVRLLDARTSVLDATDLIEGAALDRYEFVRDAYMQRRQNKINDGGDGRRRDEDSTAPGRNPDSKSLKGAALDDTRVGQTPDPAPAAAPGGTQVITPTPTPTLTPPLPAARSESK